MILRMILGASTLLFVVTANAVCPTSPLQSAIADLNGHMDRLKIESANGSFAKSCFNVGVASELARSVEKAIFFEPKSSSADTYMYTSLVDYMQVFLGEMTDICENQVVEAKVPELTNATRSALVASAKLRIALKSECQSNAKH